jgi:carbamoyl-phosphate synthase large subunit/carbamoyl-phosphate synthase small subunit
MNSSVNSQQNLKQTKYVLNVYLSHDVESSNQQHKSKLRNVLNAIEKNNDEDLCLTLNTSKALLTSEDYEEQFTKTFGVAYNSYNLRNIRLNMLDQSDAIVVVQTSKITNLTSLEIGYNLKKSPLPLPMLFIVDKSLPFEPYVSLQREFPDHPIEVVTTDEEDLQNIFRRWAIESYSHKKRNEGKQGITMPEVHLVDKTPKDEATRLGQMKVSNIEIEGTKYNDRFENPENKNSPDLAKKATFHLKSGLKMTGYSFGAAISRSGEAVFQTSMVSYPEMLTDPSYKDQIIICSSVILGQYGIPERTRDRYGLLERFESEEIHCAGLIITDYSFNYSHYQSIQSLSKWLAQYNVPAIYGYEVDTRNLILKIRETGSELGKIVQESDNADNIPFDDPNLRNLCAEVGVKKPVYYEGTGNFKVILVDFGVKNNIIRGLLDRSLSVLVVPWNYDYTNEQYDGIMLSNGPGDPRLLETSINILKNQMKKDNTVPIFGVCMGNQILSCAAGARIYKLAYGNRGHNQPVVDVTTGKCYITSQNHGYAVDHKTLPADWQAYFVNLNDHSNEGIKHVTKPYFSSQFHPEACGGPWDTRFLFDIFFKDIVESKLYFGKKSMLKLIENPQFHLLPGQQIIDHTNSESRPFKMEFFEKRKKIKSVLIIGSGPLQIGQAGEFDYSGCQAIIAMKEEKIQTILVNPNIATVQTRAEGMADKVYLVPLTVESLTEIIEKERPEGLLLGFGGQTALNLGIKLDKLGLLKKYNIKVLGTPIATIEDTEDRELFNRRLAEINEPVAKSYSAINTAEAVEAANKIGYPVIARAAYALGGLGSGFAENEEELRKLCVEAFVYSPQVLVEKDLRGWKELEYEVVRDAYDNCITPAALENINPMGIHTGESMVITPLMTITDEEHFYLRRKAIKVVRHLGVVGECNIQYALNPKSKEVFIIEVNARLSRSSALASKATCYPLAYIAAKIALGYPLPKIPNIVTSITTSFFEPSLDYVVIKIPRWDLTKFNGVSRKIGSMMKSVGEIMSIGRNFEEAFQKGLRMVNPNVQGFTFCPESKLRNMFKEDEHLTEELKKATDNHIFAIFQAFYQGWSIERISKLNKMDHWFLAKLERIVQIHKRIEKYSVKDVPAILIKDAKQAGFSDKQISILLKCSEIEARNFRKSHNIIPYTKKIDTLGGEFPCVSNNLYLSYNANKDEIDYQNGNPKGVIVVGSGCYRIGSSVEFDWCGVELIKEIRESLKVSTIMINNNPETVSTDHTTCDKLYFEEISVERVLDIYEKEDPHGVVLSFGGQFPNNLAIPLNDNGVRILGTTAHSVDMAEDRAKFSQLCHDLNIHQPEWTEFTDINKGLEFANKVGFPVILRPSYVLSGAAMRLVFNESEFKEMLIKACDVSPDKPVVISKYVEDSMEVDFDGVALNGKILVHAVSQHIESAGIHSGDSSLILPAPDIKKDQRKKVLEIAEALTTKLNVNGPFNIQFLYKDKTYSVIEMNLRASRSFPFISKVLGINFMNISAKVLLDSKNAKSIVCDPEDLGLKHTGVKCPKFSYKRLAGSDPILGLEMASTGESGCIGSDAFEALLKSLLSTDIEIPEYGNIIIVSERAKALKDYSLFFKHLSVKGYGFYYYLADSEGVKNVYEGLATKLSFEEAEAMISSQKVQLAFSFAKPSPAIFEETPQSILRKKLFTYRIPTILDPNLACWFSQALVNDSHKNIKYDVSLQDYLGIAERKHRRQDSGEIKKVDVLREIMKNNNID